MLRITSLTAVSFCLSMTLSAQSLIGTIVNDHSPSGTIFSLRLMNQSESTLRFADNCFIHHVTSGSPQGDVIYQPGACGDVVTYLLPGQALTTSWDSGAAQPAPLADGFYWLHVLFVNEPRGLQQAQAFAVQIAGQLARDPALSLQGPVRVGMTTQLVVSGVAYASRQYLAAAALSTNSGFEIQDGLHCALDADLLLLSLISSSPISSIFENFSGTLDASGRNDRLFVRVPVDPSLIGHGIYVQALLYDALSLEIPMALTNCQALLIGP